MGVASMDFADSALSYLRSIPRSRLSISLPLSHNWVKFLDPSRIASHS
jgi:hypothetical protein